MPNFPAPPLPRVDWEGEVVNPTPVITSVTKWDSRIATEAPRIPWDVFISDYMEWKQGEHLGLIGPTGQGKTNLLVNLLPLQPYVVVFATKPQDATMTYLIKEHGYHKIDRWESLPPDKFPRRVLWPNANSLNAEAKQKEIFADAMERIYREKGWCVALDEGSFFVNNLGLEKPVRTYLMQARSLGISLVFATQRPVNVPLEVYDQSSHLFFFRDNDERNLSRLSGISWRNAGLIKYIVANLEEYQVLYVNVRTGQLARTRAPAPNYSEGR